MAGLRRTRGARAAGGAVRPTAAAGRAARITDKMKGRYAQATTDLERLASAFDYVRAAARSVDRAEPVRTNRVLERLTRELLSGGEELLQIKVRAR